MKKDNEFGISQTYQSPRWSGEVSDCSLPFTLDTYSACSYNCLYCFGFFQNKGVKSRKLHDDPFTKKVTCVNVEKVKRLFNNCLNDQPSNEMERQFYPYIKNRITFQWSGLADMFDEFERKYGVTLELLKFFDEIDYPISMGSKGAWWTKDSRYMDIVTKHPHNWHFKVSINTLDEYKASIIEEYCPTPQERLDAIERLCENDLHVTLRLRPYIIGMSEDYPQLIHEASIRGADSMVTEFFCLDTMINPDLMEKYKTMSKVLGYDIYEFYRKHSHGSGYNRLNYAMKKPIIKNMKKIAHKHHMRFYVSDAHHKEKCDSTCCCGTPLNFKTFNGHYAHALHLAKKNSKDHTVHWSDISEEADKYLGFMWNKATGFNKGYSKVYVQHKNQTMSDFLREIWNTPKNAKSPFKYFEGILYPIGLDENNDVIYKYNTEKARK